MKRSLLLTFVLAATISAVFLTGCGKDPSPTDSHIDYNGTYKGSHRVNINSVDVSALVDPIPDTLTATVALNSTTISIYSKTIGRTLPGTIDTATGTVTLDSLIFDPSDTLRIVSTTIPGGVKIWGVRAGGTGSIKNGVATTDLKIKKGFSNINIAGFDLTNLSSQNLQLKGTFNK